MAAQLSQGTPSSITQALQQARRRSAYYSFGDNGLTATVGSNGYLLQMSRYFPDAEYKTGFCVDAPSTWEPYLVALRVSQIYSRGTDPDNVETIEPIWAWLHEFNDFQPPDFIHDRWPRFTMIGKNTIEGLTITAQYLVRDGTIFQNWEFELKGGTLSRDLPEIVARGNVLIRDLDFVDESNRFNGEKEGDKSYKTEISSQGGFLVRSHRIEQDSQDESAIALFVSVFSGGQTIKFEANNDGDFHLRWTNELSEAFNGEGKLTITIAYTLQLVSSQSLPDTAPCSLVQFQSAMKHLQPRPAHEHRFVDNPDIDFILRRNLEHILSVCSIPVTLPDEQGMQAIALTCGDLDGHRVATAASFYCFQFLLTALKHFNQKHLEDCTCEMNGNPPSNGSYVCWMRLRIKNTCRGHLKWLLEKAARPKHIFLPHYWLNGAEITDWKTNQYLPERSLVDTPFHIIKVADFYKECPDLDVPVDEIKDVVRHWVQDLDKSNKMGLYAFPCCREEPFQTFYFTDHALIWRAIRCSEDLGCQSQLQVPPEDESEKNRSKTNRQPKEYQNLRFYSSTVIQQHILKRFTVENPILRKRMIALSRSPAHTRFMLRTKDTSLFHAMDLGLLDNSGPQNTGARNTDDHWDNKVDVWKNTLDCQERHESNNDANWNEPLRFALSHIMAMYGKRTNLRPLTNMRLHAISVLLQSSSPNGLFPGAMGEIREPMIYQDELMRDTYWSITFEIPYLLWNHDPEFGSAAPLMAHSESVDMFNNGNSVSLMSQNPEIRTTLKEPPRQQVAGPGLIHAFVRMKHTLPFNNVIHHENIVELYDEWLYNSPSFFVDEGGADDGEPATNSDQTVITTQIQAPTSTPQADHSALDTQKDSFTTWLRSIKKLFCQSFLTHEVTSATDSNSGADESQTMPIKEGPKVMGAVIDVPKRRHMQIKSKRHSFGEAITEEEYVKSMMRRGRSPETAKKRFWWFFSPEAGPNKLCDRTFPSNSSTANKELSSFVQRHQSYGKFFFEDTVPVLNTWSTELHLSFYILGSREMIDKQIQNFKGLRFPTSEAGIKGKTLTRVAMSFQFEGDFFDRYWTCHFLEADPRIKLEGMGVEKIFQGAERLLTRGRKLSEADRRKAPWQQRRVLELLLFDRIISEMHKGAVEILDEAKSIFQDRGLRHDKEVVEDDSEHVHYRAFTKTSKRYQNAQKVLQVVESDMAENLAKIDLWQKREAERQSERPRWTFNDESRYRSVISKQAISNDHSIQELIRMHNNITKYNESLSKSLELMRTDLEQRRADDIQRFTYVTVVFLPLGFATGVFSMNQAPESLTLAYMISTAMAALLITTLLLFNAKGIELLWQRRHSSGSVQWRRKLKSGNTIPEIKPSEVRSGIAGGGLGLWRKPWSKRNRTKESLELSHLQQGQDPGDNV